MSWATLLTDGCSEAARTHVLTYGRPRITKDSGPPCAYSTLRHARGAHDRARLQSPGLKTSDFDFVLFQRIAQHIVSRMLQQIRPEVVHSFYAK